MKKSLWNVLRLPFPLGLRKRRLITAMAFALTKHELADVKYLAKLHKVGFSEDGFGARICSEARWPQLNLGVEDEKLASFVSRVNTKVADAAKLDAFRSFRGGALDAIVKLVAPNIEGLEEQKRAATLQLFAQESFHILLIGDPGTGKTEILRSMERLAPHAVFGLGSGTSKAGLIGSYDGNEWIPGLLVQANEGHALIDELNLLKKEDRAGLYSAMEKGFVTYDKKGKHKRFDAQVKILATANPKTDRFVGQDVKFLRTQLPFDQALLTRFHLVYLVRKPSMKELKLITRRIISGGVRELEDSDARFVKEYVAYAEKLNVQFPDKFESMIVDFIEGLKREEGNFLVEVGPRTVLGVIRIAKAHARARLARHVSKVDLEVAMKLIRRSLEVV